MDSFNIEFINDDEIPNIDFILKENLIEDENSDSISNAPTTHGIEEAIGNSLEEE